jgi:hypothetical protein
VTTPPREAFAETARKIIEAHDEWDSLHAFITLHWDGENLTPGTCAAIDPAIDPAEYADLMAGMARKELDENPQDPAYGYLLQIEAFGVTMPGKDASAEERLRFDADRLGRTFHQRPDATEMAIAYCADIHGRLWTATRRRGIAGTEEQFHPPGPRQPGGRLIHGLLATAYTTGMSCYGLPGPLNLMN